MSKIISPSTLIKIRILGFIWFGAMGLVCSFLLRKFLVPFGPFYFVTNAFVITSIIGYFFSPILLRNISTARLILVCILMSLVALLAYDLMIAIMMATLEGAQHGTVEFILLLFVMIAAVSAMYAAIPVILFGVVSGLLFRKIIFKTKLTKINAA